MSEQTLRSEMLLGSDALAHLCRSRVAVFGLGGVGSWCAEALARAGVGALTLVDEDTVSESNINRQCCALHSTIGLPKAEVMAARVRDINPGVAVDARTERYEAAIRERFFPVRLRKPDAGNTTVLRHWQRICICRPGGSFAALWCVSTRPMPAPGG
ncbi:MAG: hypothetical protein EGQ45_06820 [Clostridiales bacterium]|nr:hypothetical protein [Clostridiales bacterium]